MRLPRHTAHLVLAAALGLATLTATATAAGAAPTPTRAATAQAAPTPQKVRLVTANVTYKGRLETQQEHRARVARKWALIKDKADVVFFQETRDIQLRTIIDTRRWVVRQNTSSKATRGTSIVVRRSAASAVGRLALRLGVGSSACPGGGIGARYIARVDVRLNNGRTLKLASAHLPPGRCAGRVYNTMFHRIVTTARNTEGRFIIGADWNKRFDTIAGTAGLKCRGHKIDGFCLRPKTITIGELKLLNKARHHPPLKLTLTVR